MKTQDIVTYRKNLEDDEGINDNTQFRTDEEPEVLDTFTVEAQVPSGAFVFTTPTKPSRNNRKTGLNFNSFLMKTQDIVTYRKNLEDDEGVNDNTQFRTDEVPEVLDTFTVEAQVPSDAFVFTTPTKPSRKNRKAGEGESATASINTPEKTPKRKPAVQSDLVWPVDATKEFMNLKKIHPMTFGKKICLKLEELGSMPNLTWQLCRSKFLYMNSFFADKLLPVSGIHSGVKWPYYDSFLEIHDLPLDYQVVDSQDDGLGTDGATLWQDPKRVILLINLYKERYHLFKGTKSMIRHSTLYAEISGTLRMFDVAATVKQCQGKIKELESKFRQEYDKSRRTGAPPRSSQEQYLQRGKEVAEDSRQSRNRPRTGNSSKPSTKEKETAKNKIFVSKADEMKMQQIAAQKELAAELRLLRTGIEASSARRLPVLDSLAASIAKIANSKISDQSINN
ncbi:Phosphoenolpyruvate carboxylase 1 [Frankliniella fusca]|uniref:Phosphoenolpyruvate carboxylase 1 n=1 Tax=Frankliniella fusca TaxID=407009 RepID=A0AAE1LFY9_9NEOP|nr:Phosphoenolpyruvate carboxylase 1 [Frankliniella fusca]